MLGRERGYLTPDDVIEVLEGVELTPELISAVVGRVTAEGIEWRDHDEPISDDGLDKLAAEAHEGRPTAERRGTEAPVGARDATGDPRCCRRHDSRPQDAGPADARPASPRARWTVDVG